MSSQVLDVRPDLTCQTLRSVMEPSTQSRNNIYALERDLYHGQFCYDNDYQFNFEVYYCRDLDPGGGEL